MIVIDASVGVKLYIDEHGSEDAIALIEDRAHDLAAPDLFAIEVSGALVRQANMTRLEAGIMRSRLASFAKLIDGGAIRMVRPTGRRIHDAANLAIDLGHPLKDCIYLALAQELNCDLVTCDARFATKARRIWPRVRALTHATG